MYEALTLSFTVCPGVNASAVPGVMLTMLTVEPVGALGAFALSCLLHATSSASRREAMIEMRIGEVWRVSALTFDMRGAKKAQPFRHPLDGRVRRRCVSRHRSVLYRADANRTEGRGGTGSFISSIRCRCSPALPVKRGAAPVRP